MDLFLKEYITSKTKERYAKAKYITEGLEKEIMRQKKSFCGFLN